MVHDPIHSAVGVVAERGEWVEWCKSRSSGAFGVLWCGVQNASMLDLALVSSTVVDGGAWLDGAGRLQLWLQ